MLAKFWEGIGTKLADRWAAVATPALLFWVGGLLAFLWGHRGTEDLESPLARHGIGQVLLVGGLGWGRVGAAEMVTVSVGTLGGLRGVLTPAR